MMDDYEDDEGPGCRVLSNREVLAFLWRQWMRRPWLFFGLVTLGTLATACDFYLPIAAGRLVDALAAGPEARRSWAAYAVFVGAAVVFYMFRQAAVRCEVPFSVTNMRDMTAESFAKVQRFSADWHANTFAGSVVRKITRGMWAYDTITAQFFLGLAPTIMILFGLAAYMLVTWPLVGLYAASVVGLFCLSMLLLSSHYIRPANVISNARDSELGGQLADAIGSNAAVKSFGAEVREDRRFFEAAERWRVATKRTWMRYVNTWFVQIGAALALQAGLVGLLMRLWVRGEASPGDVAFAITAFMLMSGYMRRFGEEVQQIQRGIDEIEDLAAFEKRPLDVADRPNAPAFAPGRGGLWFDGVTFRYANQRRALYEDFTLEIAPGERIALVGPTGSGKSTFVKLLQRLYDVDGGRILIDGQDIAEVSQESLRRAIALVPQDPALFHRSIAENVAYGRPDATPEQIAAAARRARAHDFIMGLPNGYETLVGERGVKLSGGERQRVAIARALLADAPILIFDEATSSLDNETEVLVQEAMAEVMQGRTAIVIAHRLSTIRDADRILVFDQGRIVEQGSHRDLLQRGGVYARLHALSGTGSATAA